MTGALRSTLVLLAALATGCAREDPAARAEAALASRQPPPLAHADPVADAAARARWDVLLAGARVDVLGPDRQVRQADAALTAHLPRGRPSVLALFSTTCPPCLEEVPTFEALGREGHAVQGLSLDAGDLPALAKVLEARGASYPVLLVTPSSLAAVGDAAEGLPFTLILDRAGRVRERHRGVIGREEALDALARAGRP